MSREIDPVRRSFRRRGSCAFTEVARLAPSGYVKMQYSAQVFARPALGGCDEFLCTCVNAQYVYT